MRTTHLSCVLDGGLTASRVYRKLDRTAVEEGFSITSLIRYGFGEIVQTPVIDFLLKLIQLSSFIRCGNCIVLDSGSSDCGNSIFPALSVMGI